MAKRTTQRATRKKTPAAKPAARASAAKRVAKRAPAARTRKRSAVPKKRARKAAGRATTSRTASARPAPKTARTSKRLPKGTTTRSSAVTTVRGAVAGAVAAIAGTLPWASEETDAIDLLVADHRRMQDLLANGEKTTTRGVRTRTALLATLVRELNAHELIEEKVLYPALQAHPQAKDLVLEGYQEHHVADLLVSELKRLARDDEEWGPKFKVLKENIEHHIEEEEGEMFRTARGIFSREELQQLGGLMARMKAGAMDR